MGILDLLQGAVSAGNQAKGAYVDRSVGDTGSLIQMIQTQRAQALAQQRQAAIDAENKALHDAQMRNIGSEINAREHPPETYSTVTSDSGIYSRGSHNGQLTPLADPVTGKPLKPYHPPQMPYSPAPTVDANGVPTTGSFDRRTGTVTPGSVPKPVGSGGASGSQAPVGDMEQRYTEIAQHAKNVAAGKLKISRTGQAREGIEYGIANQSAGGHGVPLTQAIAAGAMDMMGMGEGKDYQEYQALMNSTRAFGDDAAKVFKGRQNEDAVKREIALSELQPGDYQNPQVIEQKLSRMRHIIELAKQTMPQPLGATGPSAAERPQPKPKASSNPFADLIPQ